MTKKYKVGYTTGVFDMFHIGHLNILKRAKENCDFLIVGVSTDEVTYQYKNKHPIIPYKDRVAIIDAIKYVDKVVPQDTMDKVIAWEKYHFDVLFHGDDWHGSGMYNKIEKELANCGCDVIYFPHTEGVSSTIIMNEVNDNKK